MRQWNLVSLTKGKNIEFWVCVFVCAISLCTCLVGGIPSCYTYICEKQTGRQTDRQTEAEEGGRARARHRETVRQKKRQTTRQRFRLSYRHMGFRRVWVREGAWQARRKVCVREMDMHDPLG
jgi:hypothetical protein